MSATTEKLMELAVVVEGKITKSNFDDFKAMAEERIQSLNFEPQTDEEFGQAEADVKGLTQFEKSLGTAEDEVLKQMDEVYTLVTGIGELKKLSSESRLKLKKQIDSQKKVVRLQIKRDALALVSIAHPQAEARIEEAMKNKRTLESLRSHATQAAKAIEKEVQAAKEILSKYREQHGDSIAYDEPKLLVMGADMLTVELDRRVERQRQEEEKARLKAEAEKARQDTLIDADETLAPPPAQEMPAPPKIDTIPVGVDRASKPDQTVVATSIPSPSEGESPEEEMNRFLTVVESAFAPVKVARSGLKHPENIEVAGEFAKSLGESWVTFKSKLS